MGCSCRGGNAGRKTQRGTVLLPRTQSGTVSGQRTPSELRQLAATKNVPLVGMDASRLDAEKKRRASIQRALGKG